MFASMATDIVTASGSDSNSDSAMVVVVTETRMTIA